MTERYYTQNVSGTAPAAGTSTFFYGGLYWPSIVAGFFVALALFVISAVLAWAVGINFTFSTAATGGQETAAVIWGLVTAIICFGLGGLFAAWLGGGRGSGLVNGLMVWAVAVPVMFYFFHTGVDPMLGHHSSAAMDAIQASARIGPAFPDRSAPGYIGMGHYQVSAWWMLASLILGLISAAFMGYWGSGGDFRTRTTTTTHTTTST